MTQVRVAKEQLLQFATSCFVKAGADQEIAKSMAESLLWGDLLGFRTHGMRRLPYNVKQLQSGAARGSGEVSVINHRAAVETWDANALPGLYVAPLAVEKACEMALNAGTGTVVVRRCEHVASLAAYLQIATEKGFLINMMAATPAQSSVAPAGGISRVFSPNPYAIGVPTSSEPMLLDMSFSVTAAGKVRQAYDRGELLPWPAIVTQKGEITNDPKAYIEEGGALLPLGGADLGYKGYGLCLQSELWTLGLTGYGRADAMDDGEQNTLFVQVIDPEAFAGKEAFERVAEDLMQRCLAAAPISKEHPVRVPGSGALAQVKEQTERGVLLDELTWPRLQYCAEKLGVELPVTLRL
ncbi:malate/lactate dehydrogenase [Idiomarina sp. A28L]|uniref:Ldh family oxidoreductase n=1 Tax=Idiomarina sp. A28L TaxID=1036674 RepID=UPI000213889F|nr:Ldh family oxidoreductase [Idiomarina sp. A28L]EGN75143.1 malate/lactate dehydrogenase [Idiomarina sp. A28L]